jgi:hypothetical protein
MTEDEKVLETQWELALEMLLSKDDLKRLAVELLRQGLLDEKTLVTILDRVGGASH